MPVLEAKEPLNRIPPPREIEHRLVHLHQEQVLLRRLLKLARVVHVDDRQDSSQRQQTSN
jgi:hypothetical protein